MANNVSELMSRPTQTVRSGATLQQVAELMRDAVDVMRAGSVRRLPVVDDDAVIGVVTMGDLARAVDEDSALAEVTSTEPNR